MMPDLGKYAVAVLASYAATVVLLAALVALSLWQRARVKRRAGTRSRRGRRRPMARWLMLLPPVLFAGLAAMF